MLRVGLTGGLGSGKSTVAEMLRAKGAWVLSADALGHELMQPGQAVYAATVQQFGDSVVAADGALDRGALARIAFADGRVEELNAIVHPAVIALQAERIEEIAARDADAIVVVESALLFETRYAGPQGWSRRFDRIILVCAREELKVARFVARVAQDRGLSKAEGGWSESERGALQAEARRRLARQMDDTAKAAGSDYVLTNEGPVEDLKAQVDALWQELAAEAKRHGVAL